MTESEFIAAEHAEGEAKLKSLLAKVHKTGWAGKKAIEMLLCNGLISFGGPRMEIHHPYNCYRLTEAGSKMLSA